MGTGLAFIVSVRSSDWTEEIGGWRVPALRIPGANVACVYVAGEKQEAAKYEVDRENHLVRWIPRPPPSRAGISITLSRKLVAASDTTKWKAIGALATAAAAILGPIITYNVKAKRIERPEAVVVPQGKPAQVPKLPDESTEFKTLRDISVWDLRGWRSVPGDKKAERWSPANYFNYLHVRKDREASTYRAHFSTTGSDIDLRCITHPAKVLQRAEGGGDEGQKYYALEINAADEPVGQEFLVVIEATYWNGFQAPEGDWVSTYADEDGAELAELAVFVLFPEAKTFSDYNFLFDDGGGDVPAKTNQTFFASPEHHYISWDVAKPRKGHYKVKWRW